MNEWILQWNEGILTKFSPKRWLCGCWNLNLGLARTERWHTVSSAPEPWHFDLRNSWCHIMNKGAVSQISDPKPKSTFASHLPFNQWCPNQLEWVLHVLQLEKKPNKNKNALSTDCITGKFNTHERSALSQASCIPYIYIHIIYISMFSCFLENG